MIFDDCIIHQLMASISRVLFICVKFFPLEVKEEEVAEKEEVRKWSKMWKRRWRSRSRF